MKFKLLKLLNIKKTVAVATSLCFLFTMVFSQGVFAAFIPAAAPIINQNTFKSIENYLLPFSIGRITDALYTGGDEIVINIQDLHSHTQAQRNISTILSILDKQYGLKNVYVEGGIGQVDTSWLSSVTDEKLKETILNNMLESGRLTGGEYYSVQTNKNKLLLGIEDKTTYINNLKRLNEIYSKKQELLKYVSFLKYTLNEISKKYYSTDNLKLNRVVAKNKAGNLSEEKYFTYLIKTAQKANVNLRKYPNIIAFLQLLKRKDELNIKKVNVIIAKLLKELKTQLPYEQYQKLFAKVSDKNKETDFYFDLYKVAKEKGLLEKNEYKTLVIFFEYLSLNQSLNPVDLILNEKNLLQELNIKLSQNQYEKDIYFLQNYMEYFSGYLTNKLTADEYEYFINNMAKFKLLWKKYVDINGVIELNSYLDLFSDFYKDNVERNRFFIKNIIGQMPNQPKEGIRIKANVAHTQKVLDQLSKTKKVKVVITGGFHTYGFTKLLQDNNINYIVITPNVKQQTVDADVLYENIFKQQVSALYNTLQKMLVFQTGTDGILNSDVIKALKESEILNEAAVDILNKFLAENGVEERVKSLKNIGEDKVTVVLKNGEKTIYLNENLTPEHDIIKQSELKTEFEIFSKITELHKQIRVNKRKGIENNEDLKNKIKEIQDDIKDIKDNTIKNLYQKEMENLKAEIDNLSYLGDKITVEQEQNYFNKANFKAEDELQSLANNKKTYRQVFYPSVKRHDSFRDDFIQIRTEQLDNFVKEKAEDFSKGKYEGFNYAYIYYLAKNNKTDELQKYVENTANELNYRLFAFMYLRISGKDLDVNIKNELINDFKKLENNKNYRENILNNFDLQAYITGKMLISEDKFVSLINKNEVDANSIIKNIYSKIPEAIFLTDSFGSDEQVSFHDLSFSVNYGNNLSSAVEKQLNYNFIKELMFYSAYKLNGAVIESSNKKLPWLNDKDFKNLEYLDKQINEIINEFNNLSETKLEEKIQKSVRTINEQIETPDQQAQTTGLDLEKRERLVRRLSDDITNKEETARNVMIAIGEIDKGNYEKEYSKYTEFYKENVFSKTKAGNNEPYSFGEFLYDLACNNSDVSLILSELGEKISNKTVSKQDILEAITDIHESDLIKDYRIMINNGSDYSDSDFIESMLDFFSVRIEKSMIRQGMINQDNEKVKDLKLLIKVAREKDYIIIEGEDVKNKIRNINPENYPKEIKEYVRLIKEDAINYRFVPKGYDYKRKEQFNSYWDGNLNKKIREYFPITKVYDYEKFKEFNRELDTFEGNLSLKLTTEMTEKDERIRELDAYIENEENNLLWRFIKSIYRETLVGLKEFRDIFDKSNKFLNKHPIYVWAKANNGNEQADKVKASMEKGVNIVKYGSLAATMMAAITSLILMGDISSLHGFIVSFINSIVVFIISGVGIHAGVNVYQEWFGNKKAKLDMNRDTPFKEFIENVENSKDPVKVYIPLSGGGYDVEFVEPESGLVQKRVKDLQNKAGSITTSKEEDYVFKEPEESKSGQRTIRVTPSQGVSYSIFTDNLDKQLKELGSEGYINKSSIDDSEIKFGPKGYFEVEPEEQKKQESKNATKNLILGEISIAERMSGTGIDDVSSPLESVMMKIDGDNVEVAKQITDDTERHYFYINVDGKWYNLFYEGNPLILNPKEYSLFKLRSENLIETANNPKIDNLVEYLKDRYIKNKKENYGFKEAREDAETIKKYIENNGNNLSDNDIAKLRALTLTNFVINEGKLISFRDKTWTPNTESLKNMIEEIDINNLPNSEGCEKEIKRLKKFTLEKLEEGKELNDKYNKEKETAEGIKNKFSVDEVNELEKNNEKGLKTLLFEFFTEDGVNKLENKTNSEIQKMQEQIKGITIEDEKDKIPYITENDIKEINELKEFARYILDKEQERREKQEINQNLSGERIETQKKEELEKVTNNTKNIKAKLYEDTDKLNELKEYNREGLKTLFSFIINEEYNSLEYEFNFEIQKKKDQIEKINIEEEKKPYITENDIKGIKELKNFALEILETRLNETNIQAQENAQLDLGWFGDRFKNKPTARAIFVGIIESILLVPISIADSIEKAVTGKQIGTLGQWFLNKHDKYANAVKTIDKTIKEYGSEEKIRDAATIFSQNAYEEKIPTVYLLKIIDSENMNGFTNEYLAEAFDEISKTWGDNESIDHLSALKNYALAKIQKELMERGLTKVEKTTAVAAIATSVSMATMFLTGTNGYSVTDAGIFITSVTFVINMITHAIHNIRNPKAKLDMFEKFAEDIEDIKDHDDLSGILEHIHNIHYDYEDFEEYFQEFYGYGFTPLLKELYIYTITVEVKLLSEEKGTITKDDSRKRILSRAREKLIEEVNKLGEEELTRESIEKIKNSLQEQTASMLKISEKGVPNISVSEKTLLKWKNYKRDTSLDLGWFGDRFENQPTLRAIFVGIIESVLLAPISVIDGIEKAVTGKQIGTLGQWFLNKHSKYANAVKTQQEIDLDSYSNIEEDTKTLEPYYTKGAETGYLLDIVKGDIRTFTNEQLQEYKENILNIQDNGSIPQKDNLKNYALAKINKEQSRRLQEAMEQGLTKVEKTTAVAAIATSVSMATMFLTGTNGYSVTDAGIFITAVTFVINMITHAIHNIRNPKAKLDMFDENLELDLSLEEISPELREIAHGETGYYSGETYGYLVRRLNYDPYFRYSKDKEKIARNIIVAIEELDKNKYGKYDKYINFYKEHIVDEVLWDKDKEISDFGKFGNFLYWEVCFHHRDLYPILNELGEKINNKTVNEKDILYTTINIYERHLISELNYIEGKNSDYVNDRYAFAETLRLFFSVQIEKYMIEKGEDEKLRKLINLARVKERVAQDEFLEKEGVKEVKDLLRDINSKDYPEIEEIVKLLKEDLEEYPYGKNVYNHERLNKLGSYWKENETILKKEYKVEGYYELIDKIEKDKSETEAQLLINRLNGTKYDYSKDKEKLVKNAAAALEILKEEKSVYNENDLVLKNYEELVEYLKIWINEEEIYEALNTLGEKVNNKTAKQEDILLALNKIKEHKIIRELDSVYNRLESARRKKEYDNNLAEKYMRYRSELLAVREQIEKLEQQTEQETENKVEKSFNVATEQTTGIIKAANKWLQIQSLNIISLFKEKAEIFALVDINDEKAINEAITLANEGIKIKLVVVGSAKDIGENELLKDLAPAEETNDPVSGNNDNNLSFKVINNNVKNLEVATYETLDGNILNSNDTIDNLLEQLNNIEGKKVLYVSENLAEQNKEKFDNADILSYNTKNIVTAIAEGVVAYKNKDEVLNAVVSYDSIIATYDVKDENINYETEKANLNSQKISRVMIKISDESEIKKAKEKANAFRKNEVSNDIIIVLVKGDGYEIIPENEENKVTNKVISYEQALKEENIDKSDKEVIVYVGIQEQENLTINANDMKNLLDKGVTLAFDSEIIDYMDSSNTEKEGISMLSIINLILKQNSPETKIIKGRNFVIKNNVTEEQETSLIKAYNNEKDLRKLLSELGIKNIENSKFEEMRYIALGIIQAVELQKVNPNLLENLNKDKISNELLTMLGMYKLSSKGNKSYTPEREGEEKIKSNDNKTTVEFLNELRAKVKANEKDTAAIAGIIDILLTEQLNILDDIEKLLDIEDAKSIQSILAAA